jgi:DNA-binding Lrp family transcriptional regulator
VQNAPDQSRDDERGEAAREHDESRLDGAQAEAGVLYFDLELDMAAFGFRSTTWLWIAVPPSHLAAVGEALAKFPEVAYAAATTGTANLAVCAVCANEPEFYEFLTEKVGSLPGVERVETAPVIRTIKQASAVVAPGHSSSERTVATPHGQPLRRAGQPVNPGERCARRQRARYLLRH